jgi:hypothetical protein
MTLAQKLTRLKKFNEDKKEPDWEAYKEIWKASVQEIQNTIVHKWEMLSTIYLPWIISCKKK